MRTICPDLVLYKQFFFHGNSWPNVGCDVTSALTASFLTTYKGRGTGVNAKPDLPPFRSFLSVAAARWVGGLGVQRLSSSHATLHCGMAKSTPESCYAKHSDASACKGSPSVYVAQLLLEAQGLPSYMGAATSLVQEISATPSRGYKFHQLRNQARKTPGGHPWAQTEERLSSRCNSRDMAYLKPALKWKRKVGAICPDWALCKHFFFKRDS